MAPMYRMYLQGFGTPGVTGGAKTEYWSAAAQGAALGLLQCLNVRLWHWQEQVPPAKAAALVHVKLYKSMAWHLSASFQTLNPKPE
ncbi:hypothetical protein PIB30_086750 [Stylosanthes scabra]|uniref:Uncharacterized protein n=1 Tax=Stylosanthes scabra TaxID=79078 RepID=A0ABU6YQU6_9FABA|nr:hypothetical protein [Stylosanthes scabra]